MKNKLMIAAGVTCAVAAGANSIGGLVLACLGHDTLGVPFVFCGVLLFALTEMLLGRVHEVKQPANHGKV